LIIFDDVADDTCKFVDDVIWDPLPNYIYIFNSKVPIVYELKDTKFSILNIDSGGFIINILMGVRYKFVIHKYNVVKILDRLSGICFEMLLNIDDDGYIFELPKERRVFVNSKTGIIQWNNALKLNKRELSENKAIAKYNICLNNSFREEGLCDLIGG
jgi:hypothetical protein